MWSDLLVGLIGIYIFVDGLVLWKNSEEWKYPFILGHVIYLYLPRMMDYRSMVSILRERKMIEKRDAGEYNRRGMEKEKAAANLFEYIFKDGFRMVVALTEMLGGGLTVLGIGLYFVGVLTGTIN